MAKKKKVKKVKKNKKLAVKKPKAKKILKKKVNKKSRKKITAKQTVVKKIKALGKVEHFYDKISVAAVRVLNPLKVGDIVQVKGHTTNFYQKIDSMQINHQEVSKANKGDDIGIKVKDYVRPNDLVLPAAEKDLVVKPIVAKPAQIAPKPAQPMLPKPESKKADPYSNTKFFNF